jgi:hypothetical protein
MHKRAIALLGWLILSCPFSFSQEHKQDWTHYVRIGAYGLHSNNAEAIVRDATASGVFGIEVDNDIPGRYESFLNPDEKLSAIHAVAEAAHKAGNKAFVYIAGTECITANADKSPHSLAKDHPDWLQRKITGEPAVFTSGAAFWISPGDEDVWVSPYASEWRKTYMERVKQIAATGIDGIYVDIPYWMTHFDGWEDTWASFDDYTVAVFKSKTGLDAKHDLKIGDFGDANFRRWIDFRIETLTEFVREIRETARSVNPQVITIPEIYPGIEEEAVRVGADVYQMYAVVDAIAHEYEFGSGDHMASGRSQLDWFMYQVGMLSFRTFAEGKATWLLNYSWDGDKGVPASEAMKNLAVSQVMSGVNFWDAPGHTMAGSNDIATRKEIFRWIAKNEKVLYAPREPMHPVGVYFSPQSRNYDSAGFLPSYRGVLLMLLQQHREMQIVTPRTLGAFRGATLVLPNVTVLSDEERGQVRTFTAGGGHLVVTGADATGLGQTQNILRFAKCPGKEYFENAQKDFSAASPDAPREFLVALGGQGDVTIEAAPTVAAHIASVDGTPHVFIANFTGLVPHKNAVPTPQPEVRITVPNSQSTAAHFVPFLGEGRVIQGKRVGDGVQFALPAVERGAVVWFDKAK